MGSYQDGSTAWETAQNACYQFLCREIGGVDGKTAFLGDAIPEFKANCWCFLISGGPEQIQNYQVRSPAIHYLADAAMIGQYLEMKDAMNLGMAVTNKLPAYFKKDPSIKPMDRRGIEPNVEVFEMTTHPEIQSLWIADETGNKIPKTLWIVAMRFRVVYNTDKTMTGNSIGILPNT